MRLSFRALRVESFRSIEKLELDFDMAPGLHFIRGINRQEPRLGSNGAGKSSVFDALTWVLFGKTTRGLRATDVTPWNSKDKPMGELDLVVGKEKVSVARMGNALTIDGKESMPDHMYELIGLNYDVFVNTVVLGQGAPLFFDLPPRDKMQLFTDVLALERWEARSGHASQTVNNLEQDLAEIDGQLIGVRANLEQTRAGVVTVGKSLDNWEVARFAQQLSLKKDIDKLTKTYEHAKARADKANLAYDGVGVELKHFINEDAKLRDALGNAKAALATQTAEIRGMESKLAELIRDSEIIGNAETCPVCGQSIAGTELEKHQRGLERKISIQNRAIKEAKAIDKPANVVKLLEADVAKNRAYVADYTTRHETARAAWDLAAPQAAEAKAKLDFLQGQAEEWEKEANPYREQLAKLKRQVTTLKVQIRDLEKESGVLSRRVTYTRFWVKGFKDVRLYIIEEVLQELELTTNAMLEDIGLVGWSVRYDIEKETKSGTIQRGLNVSIISPASRVPAKWEAWSGGEGQRLRLVGALALSEVLLNYAGVETDLEVLDEPTRHLSGVGVRDLCEWLAWRAGQLQRRTLLVDHHAVDSSYFASTFTVIKDEAGSRVVKGRG